MILDQVQPGRIGIAGRHVADPMRARVLSAGHSADTCAMGAVRSNQALDSIRWSPIVVQEAEMGQVPGGKDGEGIPGADLTQGKPGTVSGEPAPANWRQWARITLWVVVAGLIVLFLLGNREPTQIDFVFFSATASLWIVLLAMVLLGAILGWTASWWWRRRRRRRRRAD